MSWVQENKFVAGLIGVTAVIGGGILYMGFSQGAAFDKKKAEYEDLKENYISLGKASPYPNKQNQKARKEGVEKYGVTIMDVGSALSAFQPDSMSTISPKEFSDARVDMVNRLNTAFADANIALPELTEFGFEKYSKKLPKPEATPKLTYQLGATEWLFTKLAEARPSALINVNRPALLVESDKTIEPESTSKKKKKKKKKSKSKVPTEKPYELMPMEIAFTGNENSVRAFLQEMVNSKEYFYAIRALRVSNERQSGPTVEDANFPAPVVDATADGFGGFAGFDDAEESAEVEGDTQEVTAAGEIILKQVLGREKLHVQLAFDIVLFKSKAADKADKSDSAVRTK